MLLSYLSKKGGRTKIKEEGAAAFMKAAAQSYKSLTPQEQQALCISSSKSTATNTVGKLKKNGRKIFAKFKC